MTNHKSFVLSVALVLSTTALVYQVLNQSSEVTATTPPPVSLIQIGDTLPDLQISTKHELSRAETSTISQLVDNSNCSLLIFFDSSCPICRDVAPDWKGKRNLQIGTTLIPVHWIAIRQSDTEAGNFLIKYGLHKEPIFLNKGEDASKLGVAGTPTVYLVSRNMVFLGKQAQVPMGIDSIPNFCSAPTASSS